MGAWSDLALANDTLKGVAPVDMVDGDFGSFDTDVQTDELLAEVKRQIEIDVIARDPLFADRADGPIEFMDAAVNVGKGHVDSLIQSMLGYKFTQLFYETQAMSGRGIYTDRAELFEHRYRATFIAFMGYIVRDKDFFRQLQSTVDDEIGSFRDGRNWIG